MKRPDVHIPRTYDSAYFLQHIRSKAKAGAFAPVDPGSWVICTRSEFHEEIKSSKYSCDPLYARHMSQHSTDTRLT